MKKTDRILVTGAGGLVGSAVVDHLKKNGFEKITAVTRDTCDLINKRDTENLFLNENPKFVFHAAARVYGIMGNMRNQALSFYDNTLINTNVIHACHLCKTKKITVMGTGAVYPYPSPRLPLVESDVFLGRPHAAEEYYAHSKRSALAMLEAYKADYGLNWAYVISCNLFGPRDKFDTFYGHVVPSLIAKFHRAREIGGPVSVWGDGSAKRDFLYVKDCAEAVYKIMLNGEGPINMGSGKVLSIREIVAALGKITEMEDRIEWDPSKPNGQDYRAYDLKKLSLLEFRPRFSLESALKETWDWYCAENTD